MCLTLPSNSDGNNVSPQALQFFKKYWFILIYCASSAIMVLSSLNWYSTISVEYSEKYFWIFCKRKIILKEIKVFFSSFVHLTVDQKWSVVDTIMINQNSRQQKMSMSLLAESSTIPILLLHSLIFMRRVMKSHLKAKSLLPSPMLSLSRWDSWLLPTELYHTYTQAFHRMRN